MFPKTIPIVQNYAVLYLLHIHQNSMSPPGDLMMRQMDFAACNETYFFRHIIKIIPLCCVWRSTYIADMADSRDDLTSAGPWALVDFRY